MEKLDNILEHLSKQEPELLDADFLCDSIMDNLPEQQKPQESLWIGVMRWSTSIAACLLLALFVEQNTETKAPTESIKTISYIESYQKEYSETLSAATSLPTALQQIAAEKETRISVYNLKKHFAL